MLLVLAVLEPQRHKGTDDPAQLTQRIQFPVRNPFYDPLPAAGHIADGTSVAIQQQIDKTADTLFVEKCQIPRRITALVHITGQINAILVKAGKEIVPIVKGTDLLRIGNNAFSAPPSVGHHGAVVLDKLEISTSS